MADLILLSVRPCLRCGVSDRRKNGKCKPCSIVRDAAYKAAHPEKTKAHKAAWNRLNREKVKAASMAWSAKNPERRRAVYAAWAKANPGAKRVIEQNRQAAKKATGGRLSKGLSEKLFSLQKGKCPCCNQPLGNDYHLDHKMPLALGGANTDDNIQLLRKTCNLSKNSQHPVDFMQKRGFLL